jgi:hypothetical protein
MFTHGFKQEMYEVVDEVITDWMANYADAQLRGPAQTLDGYQ